jgi:DNA gyrase subunit A
MGRPIVNIVDLKPEEKIAACVTTREFDDSHFIVATTRQGVINKQPLASYAHVRRDGINAINLDEGDAVIECKLTDGTHDIIIGTKNGQAVRFHESAIRELGRNTRGVRAITLRGDDRVVSMIIVNESDQVLTVTERGYGKRTAVSDYRKTNRGGSGIINIKMSERNGAVVGMKGVNDNDDLMLITLHGIIIRCDVSRISVIGRNTQGVRLINLEDGDRLVDIALCEKEKDTNGQEIKGGSVAPVETEPVDDGVSESVDEGEIEAKEPEDTDQE